MDTQQEAETRWKRQTLIFDPRERDAEVTIIGCGNIGSHTALSLARLGTSQLNLIDFDSVEEHNLASQAFDERDIGRHKVSALHEKVLDINHDCNVVALTNRAQDITIPPADVLVVAVDSLDARRAIAQRIAGSAWEGKPIIDGRMGGGQMEVHTHESIADWQASIPERADPDPCGGRFICYTSAIIGGLITNQVKRLLLNEEYKKFITLHVDTMQLISE